MITADAVPGSRSQAKAGCLCPRHENTITARKVDYGTTDEYTTWFIHPMCPVHALNTLHDRIVLGEPDTLTWGCSCGCPNAASVDLDET